MAERKVKTLSERVKEGLTVEGDCLVWKGAMSGNTPVISKRRADGTYRNVSVRFLFARKKFEDITERTRLKTSCGNPRCVNREHIELGTMVNKERRVRRGSPKADMKLNKEVFTLAVTMTADVMAEKVNYSAAAIRNMLKMNTAMYPYFNLQLGRLRDVDAIRNDDRSDSVIMDEYRISPFTLAFIKDNKDYKIADEELYLNLLNECEVHNDHLVWVGEFNGATPITRMFNTGRKANALFVSAAYGGNYQDVDLKCGCGYEGCINPYHIGETNEVAK